MPQYILPIPPRAKDLTDQHFGRLVAIGCTGKDRHGYLLWHCKCCCGGSVITQSRYLLSGKTKSCGCLKDEYKDKIRKHGLSQHRIYSIYTNMISRCTNPRSSQYDSYGGRGITVCERWMESFENFFHDMGFPPTAKHSIDRIDNSGNYEPCNCQWATREQQGRNTRKNRVLRIDGKSMTMIEWSEISAIPYKTIHARLKLGWNPKRAVFAPLHHGYSVPSR